MLPYQQIPDTTAYLGNPKTKNIAIARNCMCRMGVIIQPLAHARKPTHRQNTTPTSKASNSHICINNLYFANNDEPQHVQKALRSPTATDQHELLLYTALQKPTIKNCWLIVEGVYRVNAVLINVPNGDPNYHTVIRASMDDSS